MPFKHDIRRLVALYLRLHVVHLLLAAMSAEELRSHMIRLLQTIASAEKQKALQRNLPAANVAEELVCQWFDDFHPESDLFRQAFTAREIAPLAWFHRVFDKQADKLPNRLDSLLKSVEWAEVMRQAQVTLDANNWLGEAP